MSGIAKETLFDELLAEAIVRRLDKPYQDDLKRNAKKAKANEGRRARQGDK